MRLLNVRFVVLAVAALTASPAPAADEGTPPGGAVVIYTKDNAPATPKLDALPLKESVSEYGITWTFEKPARVGQFINGDFYVVGPVTVVKIDPAPRYGSEVADDELDGREKVPVEQRCRNGSVLNAPARMQAAWDSGIMNYYAPEARARLPIAMKPGDSLASSISLKQGEKVTYPYHAGTVRGVEDNSPVKMIAVLTCVAGPLPPDAFRPGYSGHDTQDLPGPRPQTRPAAALHPARRRPGPRQVRRARPAPLVRRGFLLLRRAPEQHAQLRPGVRPVRRRCRPPGLLRRHQARGQGAADHRRHPDRH